MIEYDIRAGQSIIYLVTAEEARAELEIANLGKTLKRTVWTWSHTEGFYCPESKEKDGEEDPIESLVKIKSMDKGTIFIFRDLHTFFKGGGAQKVLRLLRDISRDFKQEKKTLILLSPVKEIPIELERDLIVTEFDLPGEDMLGTIFDGVYGPTKKEVGEINGDEREKILQGAAGLTSIEAETAFSKAIVTQVRGRKEKKKDVKTVAALVLKEKALAVKKSGVLKYYEAKEKAENVGGLDNLKKWLEIRGKVFTKEAREFGLPNSKGILLLGLPGCGKSLTAKAASNILQIPLIRFDISAVFGGLVGMSEANTRNALKTIDAIGPCVVWIDELEKAMAGMGGGGGGGDSGVSERVFGCILTWMQEKTSPGFLIATANNISALPSEFLRKGRWDNIFFVGLPSEEERREILDISIRNYKRDPKEMDQNLLDQCAEESSEFSGAELAASVEDAMFYAFHKGKELNADYIWGACKRVNPLAKSRKKQLQEMLKWAKDNAMNASSVQEKGGEAFKREMDL